MMARFAEAEDDELTFEDVTAAVYTLQIDGNYKFADGEWQRSLGKLSPGEERVITVEVIAKD